jgi:hypothetical protein
MNTDWGAQGPPDEPPDPSAPPGGATGQGRAEGDPGPIVRPYALVGGRTRSQALDLPIETLVLGTPKAAADGTVLSWERRAIAELCTQPISVAEVSARLQIPLGVARVLVSDMAGEGWVEVYRPTATVDDRPGLDLLERVLNGIRSL